MTCHSLLTAQAQAVDVVPCVKVLQWAGSLPGEMLLNWATLLTPAECATYPVPSLSCLTFGKWGCQMLIIFGCGSLVQILASQYTQGKPINEDNPGLPIYPLWFFLYLKNVVLCCTKFYPNSLCYSTWRLYQMTKVRFFKEIQNIFQAVILSNIKSQLTDF